MSIVIKDFEFRDEYALVDEIEVDPSAEAFFIPLRAPFNRYIEANILPLVDSVVVSWSRKREVSLLIVHICYPPTINTPVDGEEHMLTWPISDDNYTKIENMLKENGYVQ